MHCSGQPEHDPEHVREYGGEHHVHALDWFRAVLPGKTKEHSKALIVAADMLAHNETAPVLQCWQREGDLVFVPDRWLHAVLNVHASVAVNQEAAANLSTE